MVWRSFRSDPGLWGYARIRWLIAPRGQASTAALPVPTTRLLAAASQVATSSPPRSNTSGASSTHRACPSHSRGSTRTRRAAQASVTTSQKLIDRSNMRMVMDITGRFAWSRPKRVGGVYACSAATIGESSMPAPRKPKDKDAGARATSYRSDCSDHARRGIRRGDVAAGGRAGRSEAGLGLLLLRHHGRSVRCRPAGGRRDRAERDAQRDHRRRPAASVVADQLRRAAAPGSIRSSWPWPTTAR